MAGTRRASTMLGARVMPVASLAVCIRLRTTSSGYDTVWPATGSTQGAERGELALDGGGSSDRGRATRGRFDIDRGIGQPYRGIGRGIGPSHRGIGCMLRVHAGSQLHPPLWRSERILNSWLHAGDPRSAPQATCGRRALEPCGGVGRSAGSTGAVREICRTRCRPAARGCTAPGARFLGSAMAHP